MMEHEAFTYPEALRYLAEKYKITIEETIPTVEEIQKQDERESLFVLYSFAQKFFSEKLFNTEEGRAIGLSYFNERGFNEAVIEKFQLGYAPDQWDALSQAVTENKFNRQLYEKSGLAVVKEQEQDSQKVYDRFRGRVILPIHNLSGRVIAFGARQLANDPKSPKYINSPETDIYHKSKSLYGISFARKSIIQHDECFLVEGYTDVVSLFQAGVENVVASSGTSLTPEQIRLIARFTGNITILYDGDPAGIKASLRGIDLILEEGLNVKVVLFPDGDDPDSFARKNSTIQLIDYISKNAVDFIGFKTSLLLEEVANDPVRKAALIRDIVESISRIPDGIKRSLYTSQCATQMDVPEQVLITELNKIRRNLYKKDNEHQQAELVEKLIEMEYLPQQTILTETNAWYQEQEIIRLLLNYGDKNFNYQGGEQQKTVREFILEQILPDGFGFDDEIFAGVFSYLMSMSTADFLSMLKTENSSDLEKLRSKTHELLMNKYELSDWESKGIYVKTEENNFNEAIMNPINHIKLKRVQILKRKNSLLLKEESNISDERMDEILSKQKVYETYINALSKLLGIVTLE